MARGFDKAARRRSTLESSRFLLGIRGNTNFRRTLDLLHPAPPMNQFETLLRRNRHLVLLIAILMMAFLEPIARGLLVGLILFDCVLTIVVVCVVLAVFDRRRDKLASLVLAVPAVLSRWVRWSRCAVKGS
jgi:hypothetical protein